MVWLPLLTACVYYANVKRRFVVLGVVGAVICSARTGLATPVNGKGSGSPLADGNPTAAENAVLGQYQHTRANQEGVANSAQRTVPTNAPAQDQPDRLDQKRASPAREARPDPTSLVAEANRLFTAGQFEAAEARYRQALDAGARDVRTFVNLATIQIRLNKFDEAEKTLNQALAIDSQNASALGLLAYLKMQGHKYDDALSLLTQAIQLDPKDPKLRNLLGVLQLRKGQLAEAETEFRKALELAPGFADAHLNLARLYLMEVPPSRALARWHYRKAIATGAQTDPDLEKALQGPSTAPDTRP